MSSRFSGFSNVPFNDSNSPLPSPSSGNANANPNNGNANNANNVNNASAYEPSPWAQNGFPDFDILSPDFPDNWDFSDPFGDDSLFVPEASTSHSQPQTRRQTPPSNHPGRRARNILNTPDPFAEFFEYLGSEPPNTTSNSSCIDLTENDPVVDLTDSPDMAPNRKRKRESTTAEPSTKKAPRRGSTSSKKSKTEVVDLENVEAQELEARQQAEMVKQQNQDEATRPVRLAEFQCIICLDNPTDLTVTHCGHLFCSECLHEALHAGNNEKKSCPVCRTTVNTNLTGRGPDRKQPKNGFFHLEMKLMTANRKGKMPQGRS